MAGVGKSTEDAIGRQLLTAETTKKEEEAACAIVDIDKWYENVGHDLLMQAAHRHGLP